MNKTLVLSIMCGKYGSKGKKYLKREESVQILKIICLIINNRAKVSCASNIQPLNFVVVYRFSLS